MRMSSHMPRLALVGLWALAAMAMVGCGASAQPAARSQSEAVASGKATVEQGPLSALAFDPGTRGFVKMTPEGLYHSTDEGRTWQRLPIPDLVQGVFTAMVINPDNPLMLYAAGEGLGVIRSNDGGQTWQPATAGLPGRDVHALAIHSFQRDTVYAWIKSHGLYRTTDGGQSWRRVDRGPKNPEVLTLVHSTLEGSMNTGWLYAGTPDGAYLSMD